MSKPDPNAKNKVREYKVQQTTDKADQETDRQRQAERPQIRNEQDFMDLVGQRIEEAIRAYTYNTAYANFEEKIKGSIEPGKLADLTVLSRNLLKVAPKEFLNTDVLYTIVAGKVVYQK